MADLRVIKTEESIKKDFISLLSQMDFDDISVSRIIQDCKINRSTFYRHYDDKYDLAHQVIHELLEDFDKAIKNLKITAEHIDVDSLSALIHYFSENKETFVILLNHHLPENIFDEMLEASTAHVREEVNEIFYPITADQRMISFFSRIISSNILETIKWWHQECPEKNDEEVLTIIKMTIENGIYPYLQSQLK